LALSQWYLDLGALAFRDALAEIGVTDVACELFEVAHGGIDYRYARAWHTSQSA
jgi:hypothetical protein